MADIIATIEEPEEITVTIEGGIGATELSDLSDVTITSPQNFDSLIYNSSSDIWENGTLVASAVWGGITGILSDQTDLQAELDLKYDTADFSIDFSTQFATKDTDDLTEGLINLYDKTVSVIGGTNVTIGGTYPNFVITDTSASSDDLTTHSSDSTIHFTQGNISIPASQISDFDTEVSNNTSVITNTAKVSADASINTHSDVDVATSAPTKNDHLIFNGTNFVPAPDGTTFTFSCTSFSDGEGTTQLIGLGTVFSSSSMSYTASYDNGPPTTSDVLMSINGASYSKIGEMTAGTYTIGTNTNGDISYPSTKDQYLRFRLDSDDGTDFDIDYDSSIYFRNYVRWGSDNINSGFTETDVEALSGSSITNSYTSSRAISASTGEYLVLAYPSSYTSIHTDGFRFNSITCPFESAETVSITNTAGYVENYKVFASTNTNLGSSTLSLSTSSSLIDPLYYGVTTKTNTFLESDIEGLSNSEITNDNTQVWDTLNPSVGEYMLFAFPTRLGTPTFWVGGFEGGFESPETISVTNSNGYTENYYVWRSTNSGLGSTLVETK